MGNLNLLPILLPVKILTWDHPFDLGLISLQSLHHAKVYGVTNSPNKSIISQKICLSVLFELQS